MTVHPGDWLLVESFEFQKSFLTRVREVAENFIIDDKDNKLSYYSLRGIPLEERYLDMFDFLHTYDKKSGDMYQRDNLLVTIPSISDFACDGPFAITSVFSAIMLVGIPDKKDSTNELRYLHEVQHFYYNSTKEKTKLGLKK
jgi:hypothetical protein